MACFLFGAMFPLAEAQQSEPGNDARALYREAGAPVEKRIDDLLRRMTLEEKARQLDLYAAAGTLEDRHTGKDHVALDAAFLPDKAQEMWGSLGVGGIHDVYPTSVQSNAIQSWVIAHNRLGIPALFIEEGLHGFDTGNCVSGSHQPGCYVEPRYCAADRERNCMPKPVRPVSA